jgi:hypothetical protein
MAQFGSGVQAENMPFPISGLPSGIEQYLEEAAYLGEISGKLDPTEIARLDIAHEAFAELTQKPETMEELTRVERVASRLGY